VSVSAAAAGRWGAQIVVTTSGVIAIQLGLLGLALRRRRRARVRS